MREQLLAQSFQFTVTGAGIGTGIVMLVLAVIAGVIGLAISNMITWGKECAAWIVVPVTIVAGLAGGYLGWWLMS